MKSQGLALALGFILVGLSGSSLAAPGFRDKNSVPEEATFKLGKPGRFGPTVIPGTKVKVVYRDSALHFSDPRTMQPLGRAPCRLGKIRKWHPKASVQTQRKLRGKKIRLYLIYRYGNSECKATGWIDPNARMRKEVTLKQGVRTRPQVEGIPKEKTEAELLHRGLSRYISSVVHCAKKSEKFRWKTGESKLDRCTCPIVESWRLPRVKEPVRVSLRIQNFKMGISLTVTPKGKAEQCKTWASRTSPKGEPGLLEDLLKGLK